MRRSLRCGREAAGNLGVVKALDLDDLATRGLPRDHAYLI
jgi:hypothetical protein